jgi:hypothetical protein
VLITALTHLHHSQCTLQYDALSQASILEGVSLSAAAFQPFRAQNEVPNTFRVKREDLHSTERVAAATYSTHQISDADVSTSASRAHEVEHTFAAVPDEELPYWDDR